MKCFIAIVPNMSDGVFALAVSRDVLQCVCSQNFMGMLLLSFLCLIAPQQKVSGNKYMSKRVFLHHGFANFKRYFKLFRVEQIWLNIKTQFSDPYRKVGRKMNQKELGDIMLRKR